MTTRYTDCPCCQRRGYYQRQDGTRRCRYCGHDDRVEAAADAHNRLLDQATRGLGRLLDREREK